MKETFSASSRPSGCPQLQAATVKVHPGKDLSAAKHKTQTFSLVVATEVACVDVKRQTDCFDADNACCWLLLTSLPVETTEDVQRVVRFYALRRRIERFHFTLKSGALDVECLQFGDIHGDIHTLVNGLAFYAIVAWQLPLNASSLLDWVLLIQNPYKISSTGGVAPTK